MKKYIWVIAYALTLTAFTVYSVLDTFVISRAYATVTDDTPSTSVQEQTNNTIITENSYMDENISIQIIQYREFDTDIYVANVFLSSSEYLKTALADDTFGRNLRELSSSMCERKNGIFAINGDFYGARDIGYVIRNGELLRDNATPGREDLVIYKDNSFEIIDEGEHTAQSLLDAGAQQVLSFGPGLVKDGSISVDSSSKVDKEFSSNPRTAIGIISELHYVFVVSDGRWPDSKGLSLFELATFMQWLGVSSAYNLDGGGSSTMYFNGRLINRPTENGKDMIERSVSDIVYIGY